MSNLARSVVWLALFSCSALSATQMRAAGLALSTSSSWMFSGLYPQLFLNPAFANDHRNRFIVEAGSASDPARVSGGLLIPLGSHTLALLYGELANGTVLNRNDHPRGMFYDGRTSTQGIADNRFIDATHYLRINSAIVNSSGLALADSAQIYENNRNLIGQKNVSAIYVVPLGFLDVGGAVGFSRAADLQLRERGALSEELRLFKAEIPVGLGVRHNHGGRSVYRGADISVRYVHYLLDNRYDERDTDGRRVIASLESDGARDWEFQGQIQLGLFAGHLFHLRGQFADLNSSTIALAKAEINSGCLIATDCVFDLRDKYSRTGKLYSLGFSDEIRLKESIIWFTAVTAEWEVLENSFDGEDLLNGGRRRDGTVYGNKAPLEQKFYSFILPVYLGMEGEISPSWIIRFGINHSVVNRRSNNIGIGAYDETTLAARRAANGAVYQTLELRRRGRAAALSNAAFGLSWQSPAFTIDWLMNIAFMTVGPNFLSGGANDLSLGIALTYHFNERVKLLPSAGGPNE